MSEKGIIEEGWKWCDFFHVELGYMVCEDEDDKRAMGLAMREALRKQREGLFTWDEIQSMMYSTPVIIDKDLFDDIYWESDLL